MSKFHFQHGSFWFGWVIGIVSALIGISLAAWRTQ
jgi:hypothetical protein